MRPALPFGFVFRVQIGLGGHPSVEFVCAFGHLRVHDTAWLDAYARTITCRLRVCTLGALARILAYMEHIHAGADLRKCLIQAHSSCITAHACTHAQARTHTTHHLLPFVLRRNVESSHAQPSLLEWQHAAQPSPQSVLSCMSVSVWGQRVGVAENTDELHWCRYQSSAKTEAGSAGRSALL